MKTETQQGTADAPPEVRADARTDAGYTKEREALKILKVSALNPVFCAIELKEKSVEFVAAIIMILCRHWQSNCSVGA